MSLQELLSTPGLSDSTSDRLEGDLALPGAPDDREFALLFLLQGRRLLPEPRGACGRYFAAEKVASYEFELHQDCAI